MKYKIKIDDRQDNYSVLMNYRYITISYKTFLFSRYKTVASVVVNNAQRTLFRYEKEFRTKQELLKFLEDI